MKIEYRFYAYYFVKDQNKFTDDKVKKMYFKKGICRSKSEARMLKKKFETFNIFE